jgi:DNA-binding SARP family transcriptional activator
MSLVLGSRVPSSIPRGVAGAEASTGIHLTLLGGFKLRSDGEAVALPLPAERLLAFVALHDRPLLRPYIAGVLWSDTTEAHAAGNLRCALWRLTHCGARLLEAGGGHLELASDVSVDIRLGTALALRLRKVVALPEAELTADNLSFDLLPDWYEEWVILEREAFCQLRVHALESLCERLAEAGRFDPAVQAGLAAVAADPLRESAHRVLIAAYLAEGNAGPALRQFETFSRLLHDELDLEPSAPMQALARSLRH